MDASDWSGRVATALGLAHNPEVAGSNPAPATREVIAGERPLPIMEGAFLLPLVNVFVNEVAVTLVPSLSAAC